MPSLKSASTSPAPAPQAARRRFPRILLLALLFGPSALLAQRTGDGAPAPVIYGLEPMPAPIEGPAAPISGPGLRRIETVPAPAFDQPVQTRPLPPPPAPVMPSVRAPGLVPLAPVRVAEPPPPSRPVIRDGLDQLPATAPLDPGFGAPLQGPRDPAPVEATERLPPPPLELRDPRLEPAGTVIETRTLPPVLTARETAPPTETGPGPLRRFFGRLFGPADPPPAAPVLPAGPTSAEASRLSVRNQTVSDKDRWLAAAPAAPAAAPLAPGAAAEPPRLMPAPLPPQTLAPATPMASLAAPTALPLSAGGSPLTIGAGDVVNVTVFGRPELSTTAYVTEDGRVELPLAGAVRVAGLAPADAGRAVAEALRAGDYLVDPQVTVTLNEFRSQQISVLGEVQRPGRFPLDVRTTVLDALALAGGIAPTGAQRVTLLRSQGAEVGRYELDLQALLRGQAQAGAVELRAGDTIMVPKADLFFVFGEVRNPNAYPLEPGTTVIQALARAGGLTDKGSDRRLEIKRRGPDGVLRSQSAALSDPVLANDVVTVKERFF
ncbi:MAG TPA: SLBB domain-containing protein [Nevskiaceae bacterium]|nr:SLBB domain-containing protein [Nevskiaceae bacterium]